jgi:hypothetical protein
MLTYKPKFCCECGEKIERAGGELLPSRRFCDVCAKDFEPKNRVLKGAAAVLVFMIGGLSSYSIQPTPKPVTIAQTVVSTTPTPQSQPTVKNQPPVQTAPTPQQQTVKPTAPPFVPTATEEPVYYCGARTQKGAPCTRRVKGGGRCWQHKDKPAMMPDEKLLIR